MLGAIVQPLLGEHGRYLHPVPTSRKMAGAAAAVPRPLNISGRNGRDAQSWDNLADAAGADIHIAWAQEENGNEIRRIFCWSGAETKDQAVAASHLRIPQLMLSVRQDLVDVAAPASAESVLS